MKWLSPAFVTLGLLAVGLPGAQELFAAEAEAPATTGTLVVSEATDPSAEAEPAEAEKKSLGIATHKQVGTIETNGGDLEELSLHSFCLSQEGHVLAACGDGPGAIRVFSPEGEFISAWTIPVKPEAINVGSDGHVYIAGQGKLLKLSAQGEVLLEKESPHVEEVAGNPEKIREQILDQAKQVREQYGEQIKQYDQMIEALREKDELTPQEEQQVTMLEDARKQYTEIVEQYSEDMSEEEMQAKIDSMLEYKLRSASIGEYDGQVYLATGSSEGYGYSVWKIDNEFDSGEMIVTGLSGCCGQMDVQCCENGLFVAENSRHRVVRYDHDGKQLTSWGKQARSGLRGFGSCCNPMNVAFGSDGSVYTAESTTGRIKQYSPEGELLSLVGKVDLVPGCKKVAIAVAPDGDRLYMLDITRNHILMMGRLEPGEAVAYSEVDQGKSSSGSVFSGIKSIFGF